MNPPRRPQLAASAAIFRDGRLLVVRRAREPGRGRWSLPGGVSSETMPEDAGMPAYNVSKTALNAITRLLAVELEPDGILVNSVCPGWVRT